MNNALLAIALFLIILIVSLITAPFFVDWRSFKPQIESYASAYLKADVQVEGDLDISFLPHPSLNATQVSVLSPSLEGGVLELEKLDMRLGLGALLRGDLVVESLVLDAPKISIVRTSDGAVQLPPVISGFMALEADAANSLQAADVAIQNGQIEFFDAVSRKKIALENLNLVLALDSAVGPLRVEGAGQFNGQRYGLRFSALRNDTGGVRTFLSAEAANRPFSLSLEGVYHDAIQSEDHFDGLLKMGLSNNQGRIYSVETTTTITKDVLRFDDLSLAVGPQGQGFDLKGSGKMPLTANPRIALSLTGDQLVFSLDAAGGSRSGLHPSAILSLIGDMQLPLDMDLAVSGLLLDDLLLNDLRLDGQFENAVWHIKAFDASLRGNGKLGFSGKLIPFDQSLLVDGDVNVSMPRFASLSGFMSRLPQPLPALPTLAKGQVDAQFGLTLNERDLRFKGIKADLASAKLSGDVWLRKGEEEYLIERMALETIGLDLASLGGAENLISRTANSLLPEGGSLGLVLNDSRFLGEALGKVALQLKRSDFAYALEEFSFTDPFGGRFGFTGDLVQDGLTLDAALEGEISTQSPLLMTKALAPFLPLRAQAVLENVSSQSGDTRMDVTLGFSLEKDVLSTVSFSADGVVGGTEFVAATSLDLGEKSTEPASIEISAKNPDASVLLQQMGVENRPVLSGNLGAGELSLLLEGENSQEADVRFALSLGESKVEAEGRFSHLAQQPFTLDLTFEQSGALGPFLALADLPPLALSPNGLRGKALYKGDQTLKLILPQDIAKDGNSGVYGEINLAFGETKSVSGTLESRMVDLVPLSAALLGGPVWQNDSLSQAPLRPNWPTDLKLDLALNAEKLVANDRELAEALNGRIKLGSGVLQLDVSKATIAIGAISGRISFEALEGAVIARGQASASALSVADLAWRAENRPLATGSLSGQFQFEANGRSAKALVGSLSGDGALDFSDLVIRRLNPGAFRSIVQASTSGVELTEERVREVFSGYLDTGSLEVGTLDAPFSLAAGVARLDNIAFDRGQERLRLSNRLDLSTGDIYAEWVMRSEGDLVAGGTAPEATLVFDGPYQMPERTLDVSALTGYLAVLALEREVKRIEALQADIMERERLTRELRRQAENRRAKEAAELEERRLKEAAERKRLEEEAAKALQNQQNGVTIGFPPGFVLQPPIDLTPQPTPGSASEEDDLTLPPPGFDPRAPAMVFDPVRNR